MKKDANACDKWYECMPGVMLIQAEKAFFDQWLGKHPVASLLQIGGASDFCVLKDNALKTVQVVAASFSAEETGRTCVIADCDHLPIASDSVDMVLLPHVLACADSPDLMLRETHRVLKPNGQLVIFDWNRFGLWSPFLSNQPKLSGRQIKKMLRPFGMDILKHQTLFFRWPTSNKCSAKRLMFLEMIGQLAFPWLGASLFIVARKNVEGMTMIPAEYKKQKLEFKMSPAQQTTRNRL